MTLDTGLRRYDNQEVIPAKAGIQEPYVQLQIALGTNPAQGGDIDYLLIRSPVLDLVEGARARGRCVTHVHARDHGRGPGSLQFLAGVVDVVDLKTEMIDTGIPRYVPGAFAAALLA